LRGTIETASKRSWSAVLRIPLAALGVATRRIDIIAWAALKS